MIKPTVGRKVWYRPSNQDLSAGTEVQPPMVASVGQPLDATVVAVWGDRCVNLVIFDIYGNKYDRRSVTLLQDGDIIPDGQAYAEWMPYQAAQAKKDAVIDPLSQAMQPGAAFPGYSAMQPHQQRVVDEQWELDIKCVKLLTFFDTPRFAGLDEAEQVRLRKQIDAMTTYSNILADRIAAFNAPAPVPA